MKKVKMNKYYTLQEVLGGKVKTENTKTESSTDVADKITNHLMYKSMCYTYADFRGSRTHNDTTQSMHQLFGDQWLANEDGVQEWYDVTSQAHGVRGLSVCNL